MRRLRRFIRRRRRREYEGRDALLCGLQFTFTRRHLARCPFARRRAWR